MTNHYNPAENKRIREFDALRGFSIFLVVFSHMQMMAGIGGDKTFLGEAITSFYMALFFYISGFFAWKAPDTNGIKKLPSMFSRKFKALVVSSIVFSSLLNYSHGVNVLEWSVSGFSHYWFTIVLFQMFIIYYLCLLISKLFHKEISILLMIFTSVVALGILRSHILYNWPINPILGLDNLCYFLQFFTFGLICRKYSAVFYKLLSKDFTITTLLPGTFLLYCISRIPEAKSSVITLLSTFVFTYCTILLLVCLFYKSKQYFEKSGAVQNALCLWGQRSLNIYMIHYFFLPNLLFLGEFLKPNDMILFQIGVFGIISIFDIAICILISNCIRKSQTLSNWLFGVKKVTRQEA